MNTKRIYFWGGFVVLLALVVWGLIAANNKEITEPKLGAPAPVSATDHVRGPADAKVTIIEYSDFQCPACQTYYPIVEQVLASSSVPVRLVYRHFPLPQHKNAMLASQASEAAGNQGKFWEMFDLIFSNPNQWTELADPHGIFEGYATKIGLDVPKFKVEIDAKEQKDKVESQLAEGQEIGISGTPTFFVNGEVIQNPQGYAAFKTIIEAAASGN